MGAEAKWRWKSEVQERAADTSSAILFPGYKFKNFSREPVHPTGNKMDILYPGSRMTEEV
jgi:hypothetical protein